MTTHSVTFDLEDWHQLLHRRATGRDIAPSRHVVADTHRILDLLDDAGVRATFFVVGQVAAAYPDLIRSVAARGHEIGSHTYDHRVIYALTPAQFRDDVVRSRSELQQLTGQPVLGFRAPEFSVQHLGHWSFEVLADAGFKYDSSVVPASRVRYGIPDAPRAPFRVETAGGNLWEFPLPVWTIGKRQVPVGGSYFRLLPRRALRNALGESDRAGRAAVLYFHPYEFHRGLLWTPQISVRQRLARTQVQFSILHNFRTGAVAAHLRELLREFAFAPLGEVLRRIVA